MIRSTIRLLKSLPTFRSHCAANILESNRHCSKSSAQEEDDAMDKSHEFLVWTDCEMTGLNPERDSLLEVAAVLTDGNLEILDQAGPYTVKTPKSALDGMDDWCKEHHGKSGLVAACLDADVSIPVDEVDKKLEEFLKRNQVSRGVLAGNTIYMDRIFLNRHCPRFTRLLHYRLIDVSSIKELVRRWYPTSEQHSESTNIPPKRLAHRALGDVMESIEELKFYRRHFFISSNDTQK